MMDTMDWVNSTVHKIDRGKKTGRISPSRNNMIHHQDYLQDALTSIDNTLNIGTFSPTATHRNYQQ